MTLRLLDQIRLGIDHIEQRLHDDIDLRSVSHAAGMSHSSFQRAFRAVTGETLKGYVRSRRLAHALDLLETTELRVLGEHDTFVGVGNSQRLADALPNSEFHVIADAGHYSWEDNPEPYLAHVLDWIERAEAAIDT